MVSEAHSFALGLSDGSVQSRNVRSASRENSFLVVGSTLISGSKLKPSTARKADRDALGYTDAERKELAELRRRDQQVRIDEKPKFTEAQGLTQGVPKYTLVKGPDGKMYAVGGHQDLDTTPAETPEETIEKAQRIRAVATTSLDLSPDDIRFVARASMMEMQARGEIQMELMEKASKIGEIKAPEWTDLIDEDAPITEVVDAVKKQRASVDSFAGALEALGGGYSGLSITPTQQARASFAYIERYQFNEPTFVGIA